MIINENTFGIKDFDNPIYIWNIADLSKDEKIVLYNLVILAMLGVEGWNTPIIISSVCNVENYWGVEGVLEDLTNKGYLRISFGKFWLTQKFDNTIIELVKQQQ